MSRLTVNELLQNMPRFPSHLPEFDTSAAPQDPLDLFSDWFADAMDAGVAQPHTMALATVGAAAQPTVRTLLLKDLTAEGFWFSSSSDSPKGRDIAANPHVALLFYWAEQGRQVRITGNARPGPRDRAARDFTSRKPSARANVIAGRQSMPMPSEAEAQRLVDAARAGVDAHPDTVPEDWTSWVVTPDGVEFWQASRAKDQIRLMYTVTAGGWSTAILWP